MQSAAYDPRSDVRASPRERVGAAAIALAIEALIAIALILTVAPRFVTPHRDSGLKTFSVAPSPDKTASRQPTLRRAAQQKQSASAAAAPPPPVVPLVKPSKTAPQNYTLPGLIPMDLSKADISKIPSHGDEPSADSGDASGGSGKAPYGPGAGPGGERLYDVAWYREPTHAELAGYLPNGAPPGSWAEIACRMIDHYHVENCQSLAESPVGSGLARAMRQAAWQFLVRPPRRGDQVLLGTWVRIRIDFSAAPDKSSG